MFIINPDPYLLPSYRISPFSTSDIEFNNNLPDEDYIDDYFAERFKGKKCHYTINGREAISIALSYYNLQREDIVTIITTTGNFYVSNCITNEVNKFCKWSRKVEERTKIILVNHEFGYPYKELYQLEKAGLPIIEDCAHSFFSTDNDNRIGNTGEYVIYSFPKMFPMQIGGLLVSNNPVKLIKKSQIDKGKLRYIKNVLSYRIKDKVNITRGRISNYNFLNSKFEALGFSERFKLDQGTIPGVFMFRANNLVIDLTELKQYFYAHGIQCSVFYGEKAFFIPVHQSLNEQDMSYFYEVIKSFIQKTKL